MRDARLAVVGDALLDRDLEGHVDRLSPDAPVPVVDHARTESRPGGAGLAAALAAADGHAVTLITALGTDSAGAELRRLLHDRGVAIVDLGLHGPTPEKLRVRAQGRSLLRIDRGGRGPDRIGAAHTVAAAALENAAAVLVSDYGRGVAAEVGLRAVLEALPASVPVVWDPHPRGPEPTRGATVATPNQEEVARIAPEPEGGDVTTAAERAERARSAWSARALCMTRGRDGALLVAPDSAPLAIHAPEVVGGDPCGAGDRFASRLAVRLAGGAGLADAARDAVACASGFVAAGGAAHGLAPDAGAALLEGKAEGMPRVDDVRAAGGTVVATGGCFDLLHAGHVRTLAAARALGDCLVVCLNSDASVRRLKGPDRPLVPADERAVLLRALSCVDAVVLFDEDTPERVLERVRPDVWAKGGDYEVSQLPEAAALTAWGGRCVVLPYLDGRSTTRLIEEARERVAT